MLRRVPIPMMLLCAGALVPSVPAARVQPPATAAELGLSGFVLAPDGIPVTGGNVTLQSATPRPTATIDAWGRFRLVPDSDGVRELHVDVPGLTPYRVEVTIPPSLTLTLPVIRLSTATYFRAQFVTASGDPIPSPRIRRRVLDASGIPLASPSGDIVDTTVDGEGYVMVGPLPPGVITMGVDSPGLARTRLPDVQVTGARPIVDGGTVVVGPGATLHVDVLDGTGAPVPSHDVFLEDARPASPLVFPPARTNAEGRAIFDRLAAGPYRVSTTGIARCGGRILATTRPVSASGTGTLRAVLVAGGTAAFRILSAFGPLGNVTVSASPGADVSAPRTGALRAALSTPGRAPIPAAIDASCAGTTDADGRVVLSAFPPGPARVQVRLPNSTYIREVNVPLGTQETTVLVPEGLLPVRVTSALTQQPLSGALVTWAASGARVEARSSPTGDALLEGVGSRGGTLGATASRHEPGAWTLAEPLATTTFEAVLAPSPATRLQARVLTTAGQPIAHAVVALAPEDPRQIGRVTVTNARGFVSWPAAPAGALRITARADGFATGTAPVSGARPVDVAIPLVRGYRAAVWVELPPDAGAQLVRVLDGAGMSLDALLDAASDRRTDPPAGLSLGFLPPGAYVIEVVGLKGDRLRRHVPIRVVDRDVMVIVR